MLTVDKNFKFTKYCKEQPYLFSNPIIVSFFKKEKNILLLLDAHAGKLDAQKELEETFRKHFFRIRFINFLVSTIKFCTIDQLRMNHKRNLRNQLTFDRPLSKDADTTIGERLLNKQHHQLADQTISDPLAFQTSLENEQLSNAFSILSDKQKLITTFGYSNLYQDNEIALILGVTPQAVGKTRKLALKKMRKVLLEEGFDWIINRLHS
jgi:DNA-directed RNA polymerase specialized sigma24 family protein